MMRDGAFLLRCADVLRFGTAAAAAACVLHTRAWKGLSAPPQVCDEHPELTPDDVAAACLFVGGKLHHCTRKARDVVNAVYYVVHGEAAELQIDEALFAMKERLLNAEQVVLRALAFDCRVAPPHPFLLNYVRSFCRAGQQRPVAQLATALLNDAVVTELYAASPPAAVATVALHAAQTLLSASPAQLAPTASQALAATDLADADLVDLIIDEAQREDGGAPAPAPQLLYLATPLWAKVVDADVPWLHRETAAMLARYGVVACAPA
eukprot:TRINITY_DN9661_c0_g1_i1.p2 TRINITY_DN9661_c0_g1~~TRINITY_DN9661_c0_g1_i1.p2  ORF type:complete len:266 (+),score=108.03 TRINITY_DN9661_c0_g1_i1:117-914(+)